MHNGGERRKIKKGSMKLERSRPQQAVAIRMRMMVGMTVMNNAYFANMELIMQFFHLAQHELLVTTNGL
jgi:hypothetical protein